jgi:hypothetical protein
MALWHSLTIALIGGPLLMRPVQTVFLLNVIVPIVGFGVAYTPMDVDVMVLLPSKYDVALRLSMLRRWALWFALRYVPVAFVLLLVGIPTLTSVSEVHEPVVFRRTSEYESDAVSAAQAFCSLAATYLLCWLSMTYLSRHTTVPFYIRDPDAREKRRCALLCKRWIACCAVAMFAMVVFVLVTTPTASWKRLKEKLPVWCVVVVALWPIVQYLIDIPLKRKRHAAFTFQQKLQKLRFTTRLGMYSPVGSEDVYHEERAEAAPTQELERVNPMKRFLAEWVSIDSGKAERQCVCEVRGL